MLSSAADRVGEGRAYGEPLKEAAEWAARKCCHRRMAHFLAMSEAKVKFTVHVYDADLAAHAKANDIPEGDAAEEFAIVASEYVADALHAKFENITIATTREDGSLLFTERPGDFPD